MTLRAFDPRRVAGVLLLVLGLALLPADLAGQEGEQGRDDDQIPNLGLEAWPILSVGLGPAIDLDDPDAVIFFEGGAGLEVRVGQRFGVRGDLEMLLGSSGGGVFQAEAPAAVLYLDDRGARASKLRGGSVVWFRGGGDGSAFSVTGFFAAFSTPMAGGDLRFDVSASVLHGDGVVAGIGLDLYLR